MATFSSILAWRIPWTEKLAGLQAMELQRVGHDFHFRGFPVSSDGKESACNAGDPSSILERVDPLTGIQEKENGKKYFEK